MKPFDPFLSSRLVYRAVADTPADAAFVHAVQADAEAQSGSSYGLLRPESTQDSDRFRAQVAEKCLLGAIVCLRLPEGDAERGGEKQGEEEEERGGGGPAVVRAGEPVGILCLKANPPSWGPHRWTDVSIDIVGKHRGRGYGGEAIRWGLWYGFQMAGLHRVQIQAFSFNDGALRLYQRLGFREEGRQREHMWFNGAWHDVLVA
ncbi:GNAT family acetyltransferase [Xylariaceae sp. FL0804]|nr:GNAT family acetyltransferase [Xylariaceae sp. FL0804]